MKYKEEWVACSKCHGHAGGWEKNPITDVWQELDLVRQFVVGEGPRELLAVTAIAEITSCREEAELLPQSHRAFKPGPVVIAGLNRDMVLARAIKRSGATIVGIISLDWKGWLGKKGKEGEDPEDWEIRSLARLDDLAIEPGRGYGPLGSSLIWSHTETLQIEGNLRPNVSELAKGLLDATQERDEDLERNLKGGGWRGMGLEITLEPKQQREVRLAASLFLGAQSACSSWEGRVNFFRHVNENHGGMNFVENSKGGIC